MISSYRLGDLVCLNLNEEEEISILSQDPNTIGSQYILQKRLILENNIGLNTNLIDIITDIVLYRINKYTCFFPKDIHVSTVIHLRIGDVVSGNQFHELQKRPLSISCLKNSIPNLGDKIYVIGKCFFAKPSSTNYHECIHNSNSYLQDVLNQFNGEYFDGGHADIDLLCGIKCKTFIQGRGYFSKLIVEIRKKLNLLSIETEVETSREP
jgi:hypothetical protein